MTKFHKEVSPQIRDLISLKFKNHDLDELHESILTQLNDCLAVQSLIFHNENSLVDMFINDQLTNSFTFSPSMDPAANQETLIASMQCTSLLEPAASRLLLSPSTKNDLRIFQRQTHPSFQVAGPVKEGFSLFNLFDFTTTNWGRSYLRTMFEHPLKDPAGIMSRQKSIRFLEMMDAKSGLGSGILINKLQRLLK